jgi:hypothetical protein
MGQTPVPRLTELFVSSLPWSGQDISSDRIAGPNNRITMLNVQGSSVLDVPFTYCDSV